MNYVKGSLKLKGSAGTKNPLNKINISNSLLDKRPREFQDDEHETKIDKKIKPIATRPPEVDKEGSTKNDDKTTEGLSTKPVEKSFKTEYEKRIALQKQKSLKNKIDQKLKTSHRYYFNRKYY